MNNQIKTIVLLGSLSALLISIGGMIGGAQTALIMGGVAVAMNFFSYFMSDKMVLKMNNAHPVSPVDAPDLHAMVEELAQKAEIPKPKVYIVSDPTPNAFATGRNPSKGVVAVTTGIQQLLTPEELRGVIAHELGHIKNRDILIATIAAMIAQVIAIFAQMARFGGRRGGRGNPAAMLLLAAVAPIAASLLQFAISRSREYIADATGAKLCEDPMALARALDKLVSGNRGTLRAAVRNPGSASLYICSPFSAFNMGSLGKMFTTHPPIPERIKRLSEIAAQMGLPNRL